MTITIITVTYNSEKFLDHCIRSVLQQDHPDIEYIIIDGASKDRTLDILHAYDNKITKIVSEPDKGIYDAMNKGIRHASGDVIGFLNSDDFYTGPHVLSSVAAAFSEKKCDAVYGDLYYVSGEDCDKVVRTWKAGNWVPKKFMFGWMPPHPSFFVRRHVYEKYGGFNLSLRSAADYEIMLRLLYRHGISVVYLPEFLVKMRTGGISNASLKNRIRANKEDRQAWRINNLKPYFFTAWLKPIRKITQFLPGSK